VTAVLKGKGVKKGDTVAVMMSNCPEMPSMWLGITRLGAVAPLINTNQTGNALIHSINIAKCDIIIYGDEFETGKFILNNNNYLVALVFLYASCISPFLPWVL
jgi:acyl-coenzyme A synthetase/AMP-(fatty) acid ligase